MRNIFITTLLLISFSISADEINKMTTIDGEKTRETGNYSKETCQKIYDSIGTFIYLADEQWKKENEEKWLSGWANRASMRAVKDKQVYVIDPDLLVRHGPRIIEGAEKMCNYLERSRNQENR